MFFYGPSNMSSHQRHHCHLDQRHKPIQSFFSQQKPNPLDERRGSFERGRESSQENKKVAKRHESSQSEERVTSRRDSLNEKVNIKARLLPICRHLAIFSLNFYIFGTFWSLFSVCNDFFAKDLVGHTGTILTSYWIINDMILKIVQWGLGYWYVWNLRGQK